MGAGTDTSGTGGAATGAGAQPQFHVHVHVPPATVELDGAPALHVPGLHVQFQIHVVGSAATGAAGAAAGAVAVGIGAGVGVWMGSVGLVDVALTVTGPVPATFVWVTGPSFPGLNTRTTTLRLLGDV